MKTETKLDEDGIYTVTLRNHAGLVRENTCEFLKIHLTGSLLWT